MTSVVDASIALVWSLDDERDDGAAAALEHVESQGAIAPTLWSYEVANVLAPLVRERAFMPSVLGAQRHPLGRALDLLDVRAQKVE